MQPPFHHDIHKHQIGQNQLISTQMLDGQLYMLFKLRMLLCDILQLVVLFVAYLPHSWSLTLSTMDPIQCQFCSNRFFESRNQLFDHLREEHGYQREFHQISPKDRTAASVEARSTYSSPSHDAYYRRQCQAGVMSLQEWDQAQEYFRKPLTVAFRISSSSSRQHYIKWLEDEAGDNLSTSPYFTGCRIARRPLREWPDTAQQILSDAQDLGAANRQELCSMIPPLLLLSGCRATDVLTVLDLCAAPGSKTLQLVDLLSDVNNDSSFQGMVVANDSNRSRLLTVARRSRMLGSAKAALILNSSDGRYFPALRKWAGYKLKFDYVLADVPCSGDGTLRKLSSKEWTRWNVHHHLTLHKLQVRLLQRSLELVKKGGRVVYSTCSLDPIENEAVVASAIASMGGPSLYRIVQPPTYLEDGASQPFLYTDGASTWIVPHPKFDGIKNSIVYESYDQVPENLREKHIQPSMFPPGDETHMMLKHCCRILPQHLDSGGFFCAIIERAPPHYFAICCPGQRDAIDLGESHHGRIYHLVDEGDASPSPTKRVRLLLRDEKLRQSQAEDSNAIEYYFEGLPTMESAQQWLRRHAAFVPGRSETVSQFPGTILKSERSREWYQQQNGEKKKDPIYTPLVYPPHSDLVNEFVDFFGLKTCAEEAQAAGVTRFPVERLVVVGGGDQATQVTTNQMGQETSIDGFIEPGGNYKKAGWKKPKFFQLTLVSNEIRSLFSGGAKFNPMELGLALCWVPVQPHPVIVPSDLTSRAERSGRYGLMDESAEFIGTCATKRLLSLSYEDGIELLLQGTIPADRFWASIPVPGSIIAVLAPVETPPSCIYLSCLLQANGVLDLLADRRSAEGWLRLLQKSR